MTTAAGPEESLPPPSLHLAHPKYRPDIDGLRAIAVLSVVAFHASRESVRGGFVGVDVFFVISGFLISTIIWGSLERGAFSFSEFYSRRIRRILPALAVVLVFCLAFGWLSLLPDEYKQLGRHISGGAVFASNLLLWSESGYFDAAAETKPLLHLWSLGIEEQFYIVWPLLLWTAWKARFHPLALPLLMAIISFAINLSKYQRDGVAAFYSPQSRLWELVAGAVVAYNEAHRMPWFARFEKSLRPAFSAAGVALIAGSLVFTTEESGYPGVSALLPVAGAAMVIAGGREAWFNRNVLSNRVLVWIGLISYPLYLWHWPLLSFARIIGEGDPSRTIRLSAVVASVLLAWATKRFVERPLRFGGHNTGKVLCLVSLLGLVGTGGYLVNEENGVPQRRWAQDLKGALALLKWEDVQNSDPLCRKHFADRFTYCKLAADRDPTVALLGDSVANSFFHGLSIEYGKKNENLVMLGVAGCPPLLDVASGFAGQFDWCGSKASNALKEMAALPSVRTVILSANWHLYIKGTRFRKRRYERLWKIGVSGSPARGSESVFLEKMVETIDLLAKAGKTIIVLKQPPELGINPAACVLTRPFAFRVREGNCEQDSEPIRRYLAEYAGPFDAVTEADPRVRVLDPYPTLCSGARCVVMDGAFPLYRDDVHLSLHGSEYVAARLNLFDLRRTGT
ncbi:MAG: acyltransferase family protein [Byssovorax sp.]